MVGLCRLEGQMELSQYTYTIEKQWREKAMNELNEKPEWIQRDLCTLKDMIRNTTGLNCYTDELFLLRFLRSRKFDYDRAYQLVLAYYQVRSEHSEIFQRLTPKCLEHVLNADIISVVPHRDSEGRRIIFGRLGSWSHAAFPLEDLVAALLLTLEQIIQEEETQICGVLVLFDLRNIYWSQARHFTMTIFRLVASLVQNAFPCRFKGLHLIHEPAFLGQLFTVAKMFLNEKLASRVHFHGSNLENLLEFFDKDSLPVELDGSGAPFDPQSWRETLLASQDNFAKMLQYGFINAPVVKSDVDVSCSSTTVFNCGTVD